MSELIKIDTTYKSWLSDIKLKIRSSQIKASVKVNEELLRLYWHLGEEICKKQQESKWGNGFFIQLSKDLIEEFPDATGFSPRNLRYCKSFYLFYSQHDTILQQAVAKLESNIFSIPWGHQISIIDKCKSIEEALFYI